MSILGSWRELKADPLYTKLDDTKRKEINERFYRTKVVPHPQYKPEDDSVYRAKLFNEIPPTRVESPSLALASVSGPMGAALPITGSLVSGISNMINSASKIPAYIHGAAQVPSITQMAGRAVAGDPIAKIDAPPKELYDNALTRTLDNISQHTSYLDQRYRSKGENLVTLLQKKKPVEVADYVVHSVIENAPQQIAAIAAGLASGGSATGLAFLASLSGAQAYTDAIKAGKPVKNAFGNAVVNSMAEAAFETFGTVAVTKNLAKVFTKTMGKEAAQATVKEINRSISKEVLKAMGTEALEEALTSFVQQGSEELFKIDNKPIKQRIAQLFEEAVIGGAAGGFMTAPITMANVLYESEDTATEDKYKKIVTDNGGEWTGIQPGYVKKDGTVKPAIIMFNEPSGSTLAIKEDEFSGYMVQHKLEKAAIDQEGRTKPVKETVDPIQEKDFDSVRMEYHQKEDEYAAKREFKVSGIQELIRKKLGVKRYNQQAKDIDSAIHRHIDLKNDPTILDQSAQKVYRSFLKRLVRDGQIKVEDAKQQYESRDDLKGKTVYEALPPREQKLYDMARNLSPEFKKIADIVQTEYLLKYKDANRNGVQLDFRENYVQRLYVPHETLGEFVARDEKKTKRNEERKFSTMPEAFLAGYELLRDGATPNLNNYLQDIDGSITNTTFVNELTQLNNKDFFSTKARHGYEYIKNPTFRTPDGEPMFAPKYAADIINNIFNESALTGNQLFHTAKKYNALLKSLKLVTSLFHGMAFINSYIFGVHKNWNVKDWDPISAYKNGMQAIKDGEPIIRLGQRNGLTFGRIQDWEEHLLKESTGIGKMLDKWEVSKAVKDQVIQLRDDYTNFLFGTFGAGLKAKAFMIEFYNHQKANPDMSPDQVASDVANLVNDDFGGLHLARMGRNKTVQDLLRFFILGPDWTESNIRLMLGAFKKGAKGELYRRFWTGAFMKYAVAWTMFNMLAAAITSGDDDEKELVETFIQQQLQAWQDGKLNFTRVALDPYLDKIGVKHKDRYYASVGGHFWDPVKWFTRDIKAGDTLGGAAKQLVEPSRMITGLLKSAYYKSAQLPQAIYNAILGTDYTFYRRYNTLAEMVDSGRTKQWRAWGEGIRPVKGKELPGFIAHEAQRAIPIPLMVLIEYMMGELEGVHAVSTLLGQDVKQAYSKEYKKAMKEKEKKRG